MFSRLRGWLSRAAAAGSNTLNEDTDADGFVHVQLEDAHHVEVVSCHVMPLCGKLHILEPSLSGAYPLPAVLAEYGRNPISEHVLADGVHCLNPDEVAEDDHTDHAAPSWRRTLIQQLSSRDKLQCLAFAILPDYQPPRRMSEHSEDADTGTLSQRLLDLETRLHKRTKMSRRSIRVMAAVIVFVISIAISLGFALNSVLQSVDSTADTTCAQSSFKISSAQALAAFSALGCVQIDSLSINGSALEATPCPNLAFPTLAAMTGTLTISLWAGNWSTLAFPALAHVGGNLVMQDVTLRSADFSSLSTVNDLVVNGVSVLDGLLFPRLTYASSVRFEDVYTSAIDLSAVAVVSGNLTMRSARSLGDVVFPHLRSAGLVDIQGVLRMDVSDNNPPNMLISFPLLERARGVIIWSVEATAGIHFPRLTEVQFCTFSGVILNQLFAKGESASAILDLSALQRASFMLIRSMTGLTSVSFEKLQSVNSVIMDSNAGLGTVSFPALERAVDLLFMSNAALVNLSIPLLRTATDGLRVVGHPLIASLSAPSLTSGVLLLSLNSGLVNLSFPVMEMGSVVVTGSNRLVSVAFPALVEIGIASFFKNAALTTISMPRARAFGSAGWIQPNGPSALFWVIAQDDVIDAFRLPSEDTVWSVGYCLAGGSLSVYDNRNLTHLDVGALETAGGLLIMRNPLLCPTHVRIPATANITCACAYNGNGNGSPADTMCVVPAPAVPAWCQQAAFATLTSEADSPPVTPALRRRGGLALANSDAMPWLPLAA
eukprot:Opistho-2@24018